jgi:hypothetical protein
MKITYHWCSCGGKPGDAAERFEHIGPVATASVSFTVDKSGTVQLCPCRTNQAAVPVFGPAQQAAKRDPFRVSG